jgi:hypothetical protein
MLGACRHNEEDPGFGVREGLVGLVFGEVVVLYALSVGCYAGDGDESFGGCEEFGG